MKTNLRLNDYRKQLLKKRDNEPKTKDRMNFSSEHLSSPLGATSSEEIRIFNEYMEQVNLNKITESLPDLKKPLILKKFFKMKRNQQVEVYSFKGEKLLHTLGKVTAIGRDFIMLTNLKDRIWIPYHSIESANIPTGIPNYENSHQNFIYDNDLRQKLVSNFGEVVSKRNIYIQQFFEETLFTNLQSWIGTWVKVETSNQSTFGRIQVCHDNKLILSIFNEKNKIPLNEINYVSSIRYLTLSNLMIKRAINLFSN